MFLPDDIYPSRTGVDEQVIPRKDPVIYHNPSLSEKPLAPDSLDFYADNSFLVLPDYLPNQVGSLAKSSQLWCRITPMANPTYDHRAG